jgi:hypothetical protein
MEDRIDYRIALARSGLAGAGLYITLTLAETPGQDVRLNLAQVARNLGVEAGAARRGACRAVQLGLIVRGRFGCYRLSPRLAPGGDPPRSPEGVAHRATPGETPGVARQATHVAHQATPASPPGVAHQATPVAYRATPGATRGVAHEATPVAHQATPASPTVAHQATVPRASGERERENSHSPPPPSPRSAMAAEIAAVMAPDAAGRLVVTGPDGIAAPAGPAADPDPAAAARAARLMDRLFPDLYADGPVRAACEMYPAAWVVRAIEDGAALPGNRRPYSWSWFLARLRSWQAGGGPPADAPPRSIPFPERGGGRPNPTEYHDAAAAGPAAGPEQAAELRRLCGLPDRPRPRTRGVRTHA